MSDAPGKKISGAVLFVVGEARGFVKEGAYTQYVTV